MLARLVWNCLKLFEIVLLYNFYFSQPFWTLKIEENENDVIIHFTFFFLFFFSSSCNFTLKPQKGIQSLPSRHCEEGTSSDVKSARIFVCSKLWFWCENDQMGLKIEINKQLWLNKKHIVEFAYCMRTWHCTYILHGYSYRNSFN